MNNASRRVISERINKVVLYCIVMYCIVLYCIYLSTQMANSVWCDQLHTQCAAIPTVNSSPVYFCKQLQKLQQPLPNVKQPAPKTPLC